jgi:homoserine O-succinyltransferase
LPIEFDGSLSTSGSVNPLDDAPGMADWETGAPAVGCIDVALLNNMPDAALQVTARQFSKLLHAASGRQRVRLHFFSLPEIARCDAARSHLRAAYSPLADLFSGRFHALIVTGTEPRAASLVDEPYWGSLTDVVDWAEHNTVSTMWSCLAAHAAVLHLDGVRRQPFQAKCSGVFECVASSDGGLLAAVPPPLLMPHSRWNDLRESDLVAHGYRILTRSTAGVDLFTKQWRSLFVFLQGHPEYATNALLLEYRRDVGRFLRGESDRYPTMPAGYFDGASEQALAAFRQRAECDRQPGHLASFPKDVGPRPTAARAWQASATAMLRNWLTYLASRMT